MPRLAAWVSLLAVIGFGGCATYDPELLPGASPVASNTPQPGAIVTVPVATVTPAAVTPSVAVVPAAPSAPVTVVPAAPPASVAMATLRTGSGVIESIALARVVSPVSASAGSSSAASVQAYRLNVRMDDGTLQTIDQDNRAFMVGDRVQITSDGRIRR